MNKELTSIKDELNEAITKTGKHLPIAQATTESQNHGNLTVTTISRNNRIVSASIEQNLTLAVNHG
jgi:hypothetical protein